MGPHTLRTLLIGLHDDNLQVRKCIEKEIVEKIDIADVLNYFNPDKSSQRMSLKIAIREILEKDLPMNLSTRKHLQELIIALEKEGEYYNSK